MSKLSEDGQNISIYLLKLLYYPKFSCLYQFSMRLHRNFPFPARISGIQIYATSHKIGIIYIILNDIQKAASR